MSIIIRLQNLPWAASSVDIRRYFAGLSIPEGGVHIVGGEKGDAFIAFSTDEDARQAMEKDGGKIKDMRVKLLLSSRTEMMRVIEQARNHNMSVQGTTAAPVIKAAASDSDRRKIGDHGSSPRRREREKSPSRDRSGRRSSSRRDRSRSRSRSPSRRSRDKERERDVDRRIDRTKRDDRRFNELPRVRDERYKNPRDSENRDSDSSRSGFHFESQQQNMIPVNQPHFDPRIPALSTSGNMYNYGSSLTQTSGQTETKIVPDRNLDHFYGANSGMQMEKRLNSLNQPNSSPIIYEGQRPPIMSLSSSVGFEKSPGQAQSNNAFPKGVPSNMNMYDKMSNIQGNQSRDQTYEKSFNVNSQPVGNQPPYNTASECVSAPSVPYDRNSISSGQPLSSTAAYPPKPAYGTEPPSVYEQPSAPHQASRSAGSPVRRQSPSNQHNESGLYGKRLPPNIPTVTPSANNFNKSSSRRTQPSRFEPEFTSRDIPFYPGSNSEGIGRSPVSFGRPISESKEDSISQYDKLANQPHTVREEVSHGPPRGRIPNRIEESPWQKQQLSRLESSSWNEGRQGLLEPPALASTKNINFEQSNTSSKFPAENVSRAKVPPDCSINQGSLATGNFRSPPEGQFPTENMPKAKGSDRNVGQGPLNAGNFRPNQEGHPQDRRRQHPGQSYGRPENQILSEGIGDPPLSGKSKRDPLIREPRNMGPLLERDEQLSNKMARGLPSLTVEVRGLPFDACEADVLELFRGIFIPPENLKLQFNGHDQPTGNAFVKFLNQHDFEDGLLRHRQYIGNSCPEVVACPSAVFENAPVSDHQVKKHRSRPIRRKGRPREEDLCIQLRGLPYSCKDDDIIRFFDGLRILDIMIDRAPDGRAVGTGFVEFGTPDDMQASLAMNGKMIGHRYINISVASKEMMSSSHGKFHDLSPVSSDKTFFDKGLSPRERMPLPHHSRDDMCPPFHGCPPGGQTSYCVALGGLPEIASNSNIAEFFSEVDVVPRAIHIMLNPNKIPSGEAFAEFSGMRDFEMALQKNGKFLSGVPISVIPIPYWEMADILGGPPSGPTQPPALLKNPPIDDRPSRRPLMKLPPAPVDESSMEEPMHIDDLEHLPGPESFSPHGRPLLEANFRPKDMPPFDVMEPPMRGRPPFLRPRSTGGPLRGNARHPRPFSLDHPPRGPTPFRPRHQRPLAGTPPPRIDRGPQNFGSPGCVVAISNLHYQAGLEELLDLFHGYSLSKDNIIRKYNEVGKATGEARVSFRCPGDAIKAVEELNQKPILGRPICLSLV